MAADLADVIFGLSTGLCAAPAEHLDAAVSRGLETVRKHLGADRAGVFLFSDDGTRMTATHEDVAPGIPSVIDRFQELPVIALPWAMEQIKAGENQEAATPADLPMVAYRERAAMEEMGIKSILAVPLVAGGKVLGGLGIHWVRATSASDGMQVRLAKLGADAIAAALSRARAERELRAAEDRLRQAQKMESIGLLAGGVAHDFNNLLVVIMSSAQMAQRDLATNPARVKLALERVLSAGDRAAGLVKQLLAFGSRRTREREQVDVAQIAIDLLELLSGMLPPHVDLAIDAPVPAVILGDRGQLESSFVNLVRNAADAIGTAKGRIRCVVRPVELGAEMLRRHPEARRPAYVLVEVADDGCGIPEGARARVFEPFFTTKDEGRGTGLGLAVVYGVVRHHGGFVELDSAEGKGTIIRLYLPAAIPAEPRVPTGRPTVLLAEDDTTLRRVMTETLEEAGYTVVVARDGSEAIKMFDARGGQVDLVLLDLIMPILGGKAVLEHVLARTPEARVLVTSAQAPSPPLSMSPRVAVLQKPYDADVLLGRIRELLAQA